jgi:Leucine-rich repeat (LRR) protein
VLDHHLWTLVGLTKLEIIGIPAFEEIPADIAQLKSLKEVTVANTKLSRISVKMAELPELKILIMSGNQLTAFPKVWQ